MQPERQRNEKTEERRQKTRQKKKKKKKKKKKEKEVAAATRARGARGRVDRSGVQTTLEERENNRRCASCNIRR
jgi:hypothetical protein